ncbi:thioesterase [Pontibacter sp. BT731]|uniref:acyl-[acyl-carrier-protein] thioesterase n=1 Tax=Pontibacter coccineus TaxID=3063328 RepID=UPI0026E437A0|nr:acyl-ACP thioesterase domain-containing protein [Pontibacter sp. BT731]MDO6390898.1 thioesterase [Pontibacter sp. BT731]
MISTTGQSAFTIRSTESDLNGQATLPALVGYMQEAAWDNTATMGISMYELLERGLTWVLQRMRVEMFRYPKHREGISVETWASGRERVFLHRDFRVYGADRELLGQATSVWLVMDVVKRQLVSVPNFITAIEVVPGQEPLPFAKGKLPQLEQVEYEQLVPVRWHDIDLNRHVTNTRYLQWVLETLPADLLEKQQLQEIDIIFKAESTLGDSVAATAGPADEANTFLHKLSSTESGKELVQAKTRFSKLES